MEESEGSNSAACRSTRALPVQQHPMDFHLDDSSSSSSSLSDSDDDESILMLALCARAVEFLEMLASDSEDESFEDAEQQSSVTDVGMSSPNNCTEEEVEQPVHANVLAWEKLPAEERAALQAERQEHFQLQNRERSQAAAPATPKQLSFLRSLSCTVEPTSRLHASRLIEQYKKL